MSRSQSATTLHFYNVLQWVYSLIRWIASCSIQPCIQASLAAPIELELSPSHQKLKGEAPDFTSNASLPRWHRMPSQPWTHMKIVTLRTTPLVSLLLFFFVAMLLVFFCCIYMRCCALLRYKLNIKIALCYVKGCATTPNILICFFLFYFMLYGCLTNFTRLY